MTNSNSPGRLAALAAIANDIRQVNYKPHDQLAKWSKDYAALASDPRFAALFAEIKKSLPALKKVQRAFK